MITLKVNNKNVELPKDCSVENALLQWGYNPTGIAVAINGDFVPRGNYAQHLLQADDVIDVVAPIQGG